MAFVLFQCELHLAGDAAGSLCPDLCSKGKVEFQTCSNYRGGKTVLLTKWDQTTAVFKSKKASFFEFDYIGTESELPTLSTVTDIIKDTVQFNFHLELSEGEVQELPNSMWTRDLRNFVNRNKHDTRRILGAYQSLYSLIQQDEYLFMQFFQNSVHIPKIYGSCGHFYAVEYLPAGKLLSLNLFGNSATFSSWADRVQLALELLNLVHSFQNDFPHPLHMCDIKGENFGQGANGVIKLIDTDTVFFEPKLKEMLVNDSCKVHDDCNFFDCAGFCNLRARRCTDRRVNSNLQVRKPVKQTDKAQLSLDVRCQVTKVQVHGSCFHLQAICSKIFSSHLANGYSGLLDRPPPHYKDREQLLDLLKYCSNNLINRSRSSRTAELNEDQVHAKLDELLKSSKL